VIPRLVISTQYQTDRRKDRHATYS